MPKTSYIVRNDHVEIGSLRLPVADIAALPTPAVLSENVTKNAVKLMDSRGDAFLPIGPNGQMVACTFYVSVQRLPMNDEERDAIDAYTKSVDGKKATREATEQAQRERDIKAAGQMAAEQAWSAADRLAAREAQHRADLAQRAARV